MYVYIFEDGTVQTSNRKPTPVDLDSIAQGLLFVLCGNDIQAINDDGYEYEIPECEYCNNGDEPCHIQK